MNTKTKLMLGLSVLTAGTLAAGATGTFAWFTTNKSATATYSNILAAGTQGNLQASIAGITDATATGAQSKDTTASATKSNTSDVSSKDGISFAQPDWVGQSGNDDAVTFNSIKNVTSKSGYYTQYAVNLYNVAAEGGNSTAANVKVNLTGVEISGEDFIKQNVRVAIIAEGYTTTSGYITAGTTLGVFSNNTQTTYVLAQDTTGTMADAKKNDATITAAAASLTTAITVKDSLASGSNCTVGVAVWLEGTLADNQDTAIGQNVSVKLTFNAVDVQ